MSEFEDLVLEYEGGFPGSGPNWAAYEKMKARGKYLEEENARLREAARWIPVEERLPEDGMIVVCIDDDGAIYGAVFERIDDDRYLWWSYGELEGITHWRPLPPAPEVE